MGFGAGRLVRQIGGRGSYAFVRVHVDEIEPPMRIDTTDVADVPECYVAAARVGIEYASRKLLLEHNAPAALQLRIVELKYVTVDSTPMMFVYAGAEALCDALGMSLADPIVIDQENRRFCFPI